MRTLAPVVLAACLLSTLALARSPFDGTWRPDPQRPPPGRRPDVYVLADGSYACQSCEPPYKVLADGTDQPLSGHPYFDTVNVRILDAHTIERTAKKAGRTVAVTTATVSEDGAALIERQLVSGVAPRPFEFARRLSRVGAAAQGQHAVSGSWHLIESDLTHHEEDTEFAIRDRFLVMSDHFGRSFRAPLDGGDAPYSGDPEFTSVSVRMPDERTIEESDKKDGRVVKISRWALDPDGRTIHARFDDTHGHIQEQDGHRVN